MIELYVFGVSVGVSKTETHTLLLKEIAGSRYLMIEVGYNEAQSIALQLENAKPPRPLIHDVVVNLINTLDVVIDRIVIDKIQQGVFHAQLVCRMVGKVHSIDSRPSDAVAIAVRCGCPIFVSQEVLDVAMEQRLAIKTKKLADMTQDELKQEMQLAAEREDYKQAMLCKEEMKRRTNEENTNYPN
jgi:uncharacterized protein